MSKILNLVDIDKSDIKYQISKFPDGQQNVTLEPFEVSYGQIGLQFPMTIKARLNNFKDLELIICATKSLRNLGVKTIHLYTPYFLGSRSDRQFQEGGNNYLRDIICPIINSLEFESVTALNPHSDVLEACLNSFRKTTDLELVTWAITKMYNVNDHYTHHLNKFILISPDAGATKKIYNISEQIRYKDEILTCSKVRNKEGKIVGTNVPLKDKHINGGQDFIIIDDICDGGATFTGIAKEIKAKFGDYKSNIYLIATHGIFSQGFSELSKYFNGIYCTNSYLDIYPQSHTVFTKDSFVKQLNVF